MILCKLKLRNFRNYTQVELNLSHHLNFITGLNAQGKSNLLEAIYCLSMTRSFRTVSDQELLQFGAESFEITGEYIDEYHTDHIVTIYYRQPQGKHISFDRKRLSRYAGLVGKLPVVLFSPESHRITSGSPAERRRFMDMLLSQGAPVYLADLQEYQRVLRQRNALLLQARSFQTTATDRTLAAWDESLAVYGCKVIQARYQLVEQNAEFLQQAYKDISASSHSLQLAYRSQLNAENVSVEVFLNRLRERRMKERRLAQTLVGPHRDDLELFIDGIEVKRFGSRGEHKSVLLALKMMEAEYLRRRLHTAPIILLDDLFSELDEARSRQCIDFFWGRGQLFISAISVAPKIAAEHGLTIRIQKGTPYVEDSRSREY